MAIFRPFKALRPTNDLASKVAALPYDVMNSEEAREMVKGNPYSFLHTDKAEIDLPEGTYLYSDEVYAKAKENLTNAEEKGIQIDYKYTLQCQNCGAVAGRHRRSAFVDHPEHYSCVKCGGKFVRTK